MNRTLLTAGLAALLTALFSPHLHAQQTAGSRVAIVNVGLVFNKYDKAIDYKKQMDTDLKPFRDEGEKLKAEYLRYAEALKKNPGIDQKTKDSYEEYLRQLKRKMEDLDREVKKVVGKKQEDQIVTMFKEVAGAVQGYAQSNGIHLVLAYGEQPEGDLYNFMNINRKMQGMDFGCTVPLYSLPGVDISQSIVETLNTHYRTVRPANSGGVPATSTSLPKQ